MDTLEMCRIFENERQRLMYEGASHRPKREIPTYPGSAGGNPSLQDEDVQKIESIVDKLYDDMSEKGQKIEYRHRNVSTTATTRINEALFNNSNRRFDFAPAFLLGPEKAENGLPPDTVPIAWIKKWKHGIIPYFIDPKTYDNGLAEVIMAAFDYFERMTCIRLQRLREKPQDKKSLEKVEWVYISNPTGIRQCVHSNERLPNVGVQMVVFGYDCMSQGEIVHEVMHILGYSHEHTRPDRDQHLTIVWDHIKPGYKKYFERRREDQLLRIPYDYGSVLHYPSRAFSKNGKVTLLAKDGAKLGQREGLSTRDIEKVALIFGQECVDRNKDYLYTTCPSVVKQKSQSKVANPEEIEKYFADRLWKGGRVLYKLRDNMEFSSEEKENIQAVIKHIEKETCVVFVDVSPSALEEEEGKDDKADGEEDEKLIKEEQSSGEEHEVVTPKTETETLPEVVTSKFVTSGFPLENEVSQNEEVKELKPDSKEPKDRSPEIADNKTDSPAVEDAIRKLREFNEPVPKLIRRNAEDSITTTASSPPQFFKNAATASQDNMIRRKRAAPKPSRRHNPNLIIFTRSSEPGCACPPPGRPKAEEQIVKLNADCFNSVNDLLHVFVHILGLEHQHNMHDRDEFLHIVWDKLTPDMKEEMKEKLPPEAAVGFPYDYHSVMHYPWLQIKNGVTNIMYPIWNDGWSMGHWQGLSSTDVQKISLLYYKQCLEREKNLEEEYYDERLHNK